MVEDLVIAVVAAVVVVGGGTAAFVPYLRSRRRALPPGSQHGAGGVGTLERDEVDSGTAAQDTLAPPQQAAPPAQPEVVTPPEVAEVPGRVVEQPPPSAGRLARLRSRLARSHSAFGSVLLNLISAGKLDEQAWEEIEDTLISSDMGVGPARELVEQLKTEVKVAGHRNRRRSGSCCGPTWSP